MGKPEPPPDKPEFRLIASGAAPFTTPTNARPACPAAGSDSRTTKKLRVAASQCSGLQSRQIYNLAGKHPFDRAYPTSEDKTDPTGNSIVQREMNSHLQKSFLVWLAFAGISQAASVVISQPIFNSLGDFAPTGFGQSFTTNRADQIVAVNLYISSSSGGSDITVTLHSFNSITSVLGTAVLGSATLRETSLSSTAAWKSIAFTSAVAAQAGSTYAFKIVAKDPGGSTGWNNYGTSSTDVYGGGNRLSISTNGTVSKATTDLAFQIVAVPEPGISVFLVTSLAVASSRRKRLPA